MNELLASLERFYKKQVDTAKYTCIDERPFADKVLAIKLVGGTDGILDAYKMVTGCDEEAARAAYEKSGLPYGGHTDSHHGILGCGYRNKVANNPGLVGAPAPVDARDRFNWMNSHKNAFTPVYHGEHKPVAAVINWIAGTTIDQGEAYNAKLGAFNLDAWYLDKIAGALNVDKESFRAAMISLFKQTVAALAPGTPILERK